MSSRRLPKPNKNHQDLIGRRFGRLIVIAFSGYRTTKSGAPIKRWKCRCDCGIKLDVDNNNIRSGHTKSCGCFRVEFSTTKSTTHGFILSRDPIMRKFHNVWVQMRQRCENSSNAGYYKYGARGIKVCNRWQLFENFRDDMWPSFVAGLSIERRNNNGNYELSNCYWATRKQQSNNRRSNIVIELYGERKTATQWAEIFNVNAQMVIQRIARGWLPEGALTEPPRKMA